MRHARAYGLIGLTALAVVAAAVAQTTVTPLPETPPVQATPLQAVVEKATWGDAKAGQSKAGTCAGCHGMDGNPAVPGYPRLAGMSELYIAEQLRLFKADQRNSGMAAVMKPFAAMLTAQDMRDLGAWFQTQTAGAGVADDTLIASGENAGRKYYEVGEQLYRSGDASRNIPACMACHGPSGQGNPGPPYPALAGQEADYVKRRLETYRTPATPDLEYHNYQIMQTVARQLTDDEIGSLASYLQGLHARALDVGVPVAAATATAAPAPAAAPATAPAEPAQPADAATPPTDAAATTAPTQG